MDARHGYLIRRLRNVKRHRILYFEGPDALEELRLHRRDVTKTGHRAAEVSPTPSNQKVVPNDEWSTRQPGCVDAKTALAFAAIAAVLNRMNNYASIVADNSQITIGEADELELSEEPEEACR